MMHSLFFSLSLVFIVVSLTQCSSDTNPKVSDSSLIQTSGDLRAYLEAIRYGEVNDSLWQLPPVSDRDSIEKSVTAILSGRYEEAAVEAETIGMELVAYDDNQTNRVYYLLQENAGEQRGSGFYLFYPAGRDVVFQVPHPTDDLYTDDEGIELFFDVGAKALLLAGSSRYSIESSTMCQSDYLDSDAAHNDAGYFFHVHRAISQSDTGLLFIELHGFGDEALAKLES